MSEIKLTSEEQELFDLLLKINDERRLGLTMRVAGGWVRDRIMGKESDDIDIAIDKIESLDNTLLIVDEAHNLTGNEYGEALKKIINNSKNLRVILMTATPMKNLADDIIELLNFIRPKNDKIHRDKVFNSNKNHLMDFQN